MRKTFNLFFMCCLFLLLSILALSSCGGGGNIAAPGGSQISDNGGDDDMPSLQALLSAEPDGDPFAQPSRSAHMGGGFGIASASSNYNYMDIFPADNAFDDDDSTWWTGDLATSTWTLSYTFPAATPISHVSVMFHSANYVPTSSTLEVSSDGVIWTNVGTVVAPDTNPSFTFAESSVQYLKLSMSDAPSRGAPIVREMDWLQPVYNTGVFSEPNLKAGTYRPSLMFDENEATYWIGKQNAGAWDVYYCFTSPKYIELVTVKYHLSNYVPQNAVLYYSDDGINWSLSGNFSPGVRSWAHLGRTTSFVRIAMIGNPPKLIPIISEIYFDLQPGPASVDSINANFTAPLAEDVNMATWWTGSNIISTWDFYYSLSDIQEIETLTVHWTSNRTIPATTALYTSGDGEIWTYQSDLPYVVDTTISPGIAAKHFKFSMSGVPPFGKPAIREIEVTKVIPPPQLSSISSGSNHSCKIVSGKVECWGDNFTSQLGNGTTNSPSSISVEVSGITDAVSISSKDYYTCALLSGGNIKCWGSNTNGQLGNGTTSYTAVPVDVSGIANAVSISASCALLSGGGLRCWGENNNGQLGNGTTTDSSVPVVVSGITDAVIISRGSNHACAILLSGNIKCWGNNSSGQLGNGTLINSSVPVDVPGIANAIDIAAGGNHTCALLAGGAIKCWGSNVTSQLGNGTSGSLLIDPSLPGDVSVISDATSISAGSAHTCAVLSGGGIKCWGYNYLGQFGNGSDSSSLVPVDVSGIADAESISAGYDHTCSTTSSGNIFCWGHNNTWQLGNDAEVINGYQTKSNVPVIATKCSSDTTCNDSDSGTTDTCINPGQSSAYCVNTP